MTLLITISRSMSPATYGLATTILIVSLIGIYRRNIFARLLLHPYSIIHQREYYRLFTADFVHNDLMHLILNEVTLYVFCSDLEEVLRRKSEYGSWQFLEIFFICLATSNILYTLRYRNNFDNSSAGSSPSVMGCLFAFMIIDPHGTAVNFAFIGGVENIYTGLIYILLLIYYKWRKGNEMINHEIHFYGALGGILAAFVVSPPTLF
ncbi:rhomboid family intramembrane serine protease [Mucilaginibacter sp. RCC_168]|uniref:rhomboid family intramembrane serine protease n=1 Tax=Mucilaginibacter sp. RCC_168 TaxID=3239221 RepID=UPI0035233684